MPNIKRKEHEFTKKENEEQDIIVKSFGFQLYFEKYYQLISLGNDLLTGILYVTASVLTLMNAPSLYSNLFYFFGALFLTLRPLIKIFRNTFISKTQLKQPKNETDIKKNLKDAEDNLDQSKKNREQAERDQQKEDVSKANEDKDGEIRRYD